MTLSRSEADLPPPAALAEQVTGALLRLDEEPLRIVGLLCLVNAVFGKAVDNISAAGLAAAFLSTFGLSAIIWIGLYAGAELLLACGPRRSGLADKAIIAVSVMACLVPWGVAAWAALTVIGLRMAAVSGPGTTTRRAAWILVAVAFSVIWSKIVFSLLSVYILNFDAFLVGLVMRGHRDGNLVEMAGGTGYLRIAAACSSFANLSLVVPLWTTLTQYNNCRFRWQALRWPLYAMFAIIVINVTRISLIGFFPAYYHTIHGDEGQLVVNITMVIVLLYISLKGLRLETANSATES